MDLATKIVSAMDELPGEAPWEVLPGTFTRRQTVCREYPTCAAAHAALTDAGFEPTAKFVPTPPLAKLYDLRTVMRYTAGVDRDVVLVRRLSS